LRIAVQERAQAGGEVVRAVRAFRYDAEILEQGVKNLAVYFLHATKLYRHYIKVNIGDKRFTDKGFQWNYFTEKSSIKYKGKSRGK